MTNRSATALSVIGSSAIAFSLTLSDSSALASEHLRRFVSSSHGFSIGFPSEWSEVDWKVPGAVVAFARTEKRPDGSPLLATCNVVSTSAKSAKGKSQSMIDAETERSAASARSAFGSKYGDIKEVFTRTVGPGRGLVLVTADQKNIYGRHIAFKNQLTVLHTPDRSFLVSCASPADSFERDRATFDAILSSFQIIR